MANPTGKAFSRRAPDIITEELVAVFASKASFEFKPLFDVVFANLRARNAASGGEEMLRLRSYEKLQSLVDRGAVKKTIAGTVEEVQGSLAARLNRLNAELQQTRLAWSQRAVASAATA